MARGDKGPTARRTPRAAVRFRRFWRDNGRRAAALALTVVLGFETLFSSGVSIALAEAINASGASSQIESVEGTTATGAGQTEPGATTPGSPVSSSEQGEKDGEPDASTNGSTTTTPETQPGDATTPDPDATTETTPGATTETTPGTTLDPGTTPDPDPAPVAVDPWDWTGRTENLTLSSPGGLTFADDVAPADDGTLSATLGLAIALDPSVDGADVGNHTVVLAGDTISAALPEGVTLEPGATFDVFQNDEQGNPSTIRVATATASEDGTALTVTFVEPTDTATGAAYYVGAPVEGTEPATQTEGKEQLATIDAALELPVLVSAGLLGEEASELVWTLQTDADDPSVTQTATLALPAAPADEATDAENDDEAADGADETDETESAETDSLAPIQLNTLTPFANTEQLVSYSWSGSTSVSMTVSWCDNNSAQRPDRATWAANVIPEFQLEGNDEWIPLVDASGNLTPEARQALGIAEGETPSWAHGATSSVMSVSDWTIASSGLPTKLTVTTKTPTGTFDEHGNQIYDSIEANHPISWRLRDTNACPGDYVYGDNDSGAVATEGKPGHRYLMLLQDYTFTITGNIGNKSLHTVFGDNFAGDNFANADHVDDFYFGAMIDNKPVADTDEFPSIADMAESDDEQTSSFKVTFSADGKTATITARLPMYDIDGKPIVYYIGFEDHQNEAGHDYFQPAYNNSGSPSHGSATGLLYDGGTMTLRPVGTTTYGAEKVWLDGGAQDKRPVVTFSLWRYSTNSSPDRAAQVQLDAAGSAAAGGSSANSVEFVTITIPEKSDGTVDLGKLLREKYGDAIDSLPKYDPDGYPYVYALREDSSLSGYETVYGTVAPDGTTSDTNPNYVDENGTKQELAAPNRGSDPLIYNGGTVTNRLTGTIGVDATKTWEIAAFQDSLADVTVEFTLQQRYADPGLLEPNPWTDTEHTHTVTNWLAETLTQSFSETFPRYDSQGRELEYRWVESDVTLGDQETSFTRDDKGGGTFTLTLENTEGEQEELQFTSTLDEGTRTITNRFDNTTYERVDKWWQQPDGSLAQIKPADDGYPEHPNLDTSGEVVMELFQDGVSVGEFTLDGVTDVDASGEAQWTSITALGGEARVRETSSYHLEFENLPKYDEGGARYTYLVLEQTVGGWHTERTYDAETHTTTIENTVGPGEGSEIRLMKNWNDGDDSSHRLPVAVNLVALHPIASDAENDDGTPRYSFDKGDAVNSQPIVLSAENSWFVEYDVPIGGLTYKDFRIEELYLIGTDENGNEVHYPVVSGANDGADATADYQGIDIPMEWVNIGWDYESTASTYRVATEDHVYQVSGTPVATTGEYNDAMRAVTATNRRLGLIDIDVTKVWNDGVDHPDRPTAELVLSCTEKDDAFTIDDQGRAWVQVSENRIPVLDASDKQLTTADGVRVEQNAEGASVLVMTMAPDVTKNEFTYSFHGLPKYDADGNIVHYDVSEQWAKGEEQKAAEYESTKEASPYVVGAQHFHDEQDYTFTNTRQGSRTVTFHKHWEDHYVNDELNQRPDIYLTLYRVTVTRGADGEAVYSAPEAVSDYVHWLWSGAQGSADAQYDQTCTIASLPAYDKSGNEYVYYATESMSADGSSLDYTSVTFEDEFTDETGKTLQIGGDPEAVNVNDETTSDDAASIADGTSWAIHEGGTFVNRLTDNLVARGTKLWENIPGNVRQEDLPEITVYIQQRVAGSDDEWPSLKFEVDDEGNWQFADGTSAIAWTSDLVSQGNNQYSYRLAYTGKNTEEGVTAALADPDGPVAPEGSELLPRYTEDGQRYEYRAVEVPWGLLNEPGGPTTDFINSTDFSELRDTGDATGAEMGVYVIEHGETGSFLLRNVYDPEQGSLTVQKHFTGREAGDPYPTTTFDVYRYYVNEEGAPSEAERVDSVTLTSAQLSGDATLDGLEVTESRDGNNSAKYTFSGLDIYAPDGSYWQYYVVERSINGYVTTVGVGDLAADSADLGAGTKRENVSGTSSADLCPVDGNDQVERTVLAEDGDTTPDVTFRNDYEPGSVRLSGTKTWDDYNGMFNMRPTVEQFWEGLTIEQVGPGSDSVDLKGEGLLQDEIAENPYFYQLETSTDESPNVYTVLISNLPKWAPDGTSYRYDVTEDLSKMGIGTSGSLTADSYYDAVVGEDNVYASSTNPTFELRNALRGSISVHKNWVPEDDPYGIRPTSVTVRLQARLVYQSVDGSTHTIPEDGSWTDARALLKSTGYASEEELIAAGINENFVVRTLSDDNGWNASWTGLPMAGISEIPAYEGELFTIEYRAVEVQIGEGEDAQKITPPTANVPGTNGSIYATYHPYQPSQKETGSDENGYRSEITNTLETTSISATKTWQGDTNGSTQDAWGTRPDGEGGQWEVTYLLQQRLEGSGDEGWHWLMQYGYEQAAVDNPLAEGIVSQTITGADESASVTWDRLPDCDTNGKKYEYRVVEQVPGSYDVVGGTKVAEATDTEGVTYRYYVVDTTPGTDNNPDSQTFVNDLRTVDLTGTKAWDDATDEQHEAPGTDNLPEMALYRAYKKVDGTWSAAEKVTYIYNADQPEWTDTNNDGVWEFAYTGLPAANEDNIDYVYWAEETAGSVDGYYPLYGTNAASQSSDAAGTTVQTPASATTVGAQTNEPITNVATRLTLAKVSDESDDAEDFSGVELLVTSEDGKTYARWIMESDGTATTYTWVDGTNDPTVTNDAVTRTDGLIVGLRAGKYTVSEVASTVPEGHAISQPVDFTISVNGTATGEAGAVENKTENGVSTITVTATDPIFRGHLSLTKYLSEDGMVPQTGGTTLEGVTFELRRKADGTHGELVVATGLTTNASGVLTTVDNGAAVTDEFKAAFPSWYNTLADGLPEGTYYFVETATTADAVLPPEGQRASEDLTIDENDHYDYTGQSVPATMGNEEFTAQVTLHKYDTATGLGLGGAVFSVSYTPEGSDTAQQLSNVRTNDDGTLTLAGLKKGTYTVTETSNQGYDLGETPFSATFTIGNEDHEHEFDITSPDHAVRLDAEDIDFQVTVGTYTPDDGIPNTPLRGTLTMTKNGGGTPVNGATFELQRKTGDGTWETIAEGLVSGQSYAMNNANTAPEGDPGTADTGVVTVSNLTWGTYQFVETEPAPGYVGMANGAQVKSGEVTIGRDNVSATTAVSAGTLANDPTSLEINKQNDVGEALNGAVFTVTPVDGSTFANGLAEPVVLTIGRSGYAELTGQLIVGGTYEIYESKAPTDYDPADGILTIKVADDGSIELVGKMPERYEIQGVNGTNYDGLDDGAIMVTNIHEAISLQKVSSDDGEPLAGAEFTLTGACMDGNSTHVYKTDENGMIEIDAGLRGSVRYELRETAVPNGYVEMSESLFFYMDERGEIEVVDASGNTLTEPPAGWSVNEDGIRLTAENDPVELEIKKVGADGQALEGAVFRITPVEGSSFANRTSSDHLDYRTGTSGTLRMTAELIVGHTYDITEISAPAGYERVEGTMRVTVADDGSINVVGSVENGQLTGDLAPIGYEKVAGSTFQVQVTNEPIEIGIVKVDADDSGTKLEGATFEITGLFAGARDPETRTYTTNDLGRIDLKAELVSGVTYTLVETSAPAGYERIVGELSFSVDEKGELSVEGTAPEGYGIEQGNVTIVASDQPLYVSLVKSGEGGEPLAGATFTIAPSEGTFPDGAAEKEFTSGTDGVVFEGLQVAGSAEGTRYTVTETVPAVGYEALPAFDVLVFEDGTVGLAEGAPEAVSEVFTVENDGSGTPVMGVTDTPIEARLTKVSTEGGALAGAEFELTGTFADGGMPRVVTVGADGTVPLEGLVAGETYVLRETVAPEGYELIEGELTFAVGMDGALTVEGEAPEGYELSADGVTLVAADRPIEAGIVKVSTEGDVLSGAGFEMTGRFAGGDAPETRTVSVSGDGVALEGLVAGETYEVRETVAPEGYELIEGTWSFIVGADGTLAPATGFSPAAEGAAGYRVADDGVTLVAADKPEETMPDTSDATRPATPVAMAAAGVALVAAALAYRRRARREN